MTTCNPQYKAIIRQCAELDIDKAQWKDVIDSIKENKTDFEIDGYRFIEEGEIDKIMQDELLSDMYILGCFNAWFIASILNMQQSAVEKMQEAEACEGLGELLAQHIEEVQEAYVSSDGYGAHFARYDGNEYEAGGYYIFRLN